MLTLISMLKIEEERHAHTKRSRTGRACNLDRKAERETNTGLKEKALFLRQKGDRPAVKWTGSADRQDARQQSLSRVDRLD